TEVVVGNTLRGVPGPMRTGLRGPLFSVLVCCPAGSRPGRRGRLDPRARRGRRPLEGAARQRPALVGPHDVEEVILQPPPAQVEPADRPAVPHDPLADRLAQVLRARRAYLVAVQVLLDRL